MAKKRKPKKLAPGFCEDATQILDAQQTAQAGQSGTATTPGAAGGVPEAKPTTANWRKDWTIYANGLGGWFAWNARSAKKVSLITTGTQANPHTTMAQAEAVLQTMHANGMLAAEYMNSQSFAGAQAEAAAASQANADAQADAQAEAIIISPQEAFQQMQEADNALGQVGAVPPQGFDAAGQPIQAPQHFSITPQSAEAAAMAAIDLILTEQDDALSGPMQALVSAVANSTTKDEKSLNKISNKVMQAADMHSTLALNSLDQSFTAINRAMEQWQFDMHFLLTQLAAKAGLTQPGEQLESALTTTDEQMLSTSYGQSLILNCKMLVPFFDDLIEVLREIRDRMPPIPLHVSGEPPARYHQLDEPDVQDGSDLEPIGGAKLTIL